MSAITENAVSRHRLTVEAFHRMGEAGIFLEDDRVELIDGEIIDMAPIGSKHAAIVAELNRLFVVAVGTQARVWIQNPIRLGGESEPQPDIALLRPRDDRYAAALPLPEDVLLVVEVADTTLAYDRDVKVPLYARHGVPEVWLFDLEHSRLHIYTAPSERSYHECRILAEPGLIAPSALPRCAVDMTGIV